MNDTELLLPGLEADNLLANLALYGLLRALQEANPKWEAKASWAPETWTARLSLKGPVSQDEVAQAASDGVSSLAAQFDVGGKLLVDFTREEYRSLAQKVISNEVAAALVAAITAEGYPKASPLVLIKGQGGQRFMERIAMVPLAVATTKKSKKKSSEVLSSGPTKISEALFKLWLRSDKTGGFRWDPEDDQRHALRFGTPSADGAACTVHGANRLAALGFLSFPCMLRNEGAPITTATGRPEAGGGLYYAWPIWHAPLTLASIESVLRHPELLRNPQKLRSFGVAEVLYANRISNGQYESVARGKPRSHDEN
jgi:hypothetical protein